MVTKNAVYFEHPKGVRFFTGRLPVDGRVHVFMYDRTGMSGSLASAVSLCGLERNGCSAVPHDDDAACPSCAEGLKKERGPYTS